MRTCAGLKILFLELGVGYNTPVIIKYPFWHMTAKNPKAVYACINLGEADAPDDIAARSIMHRRGYRHSAGGAVKSSSFS